MASEHFVFGSDIIDIGNSRFADYLGGWVVSL